MLKLIFVKKLKQGLKDYQKTLAWNTHIPKCRPFVLFLVRNKATEVNASKRPKKPVGHSRLHLLTDLTLSVIFGYNALFTCL